MTSKSERIQRAFVTYVVGAVVIAAGLRLVSVIAEHAASRAESRIEQRLRALEDRVGGLAGRATGAEKE